MAKLMSVHDLDLPCSSANDESGLSAVARIAFAEPAASQAEQAGHRAAPEAEEDD
jgi:hypothetical protein